MIYGLLFFTILLLTVVQFGLFYGFFHKEKLAKILDIPQQSKLPVLIFGTSIIVFFIILFLLLQQLSAPHPLPPTSVPAAISATLPEGVQQLGYNLYNTQESYYYLYTNPDKSEKTIEAVAQQIKALCKKACTISFYDTKKAYALDQQRLVITVDQNMEAWNRKNYVYVADHFLGYLPYVAYAPFTYYPYKDVYYRQLLNK